MEDEITTQGFFLRIWVQSNRILEKKISATFEKRGEKG